MYKTDALIDGYREQMVSLLHSLSPFPAFKSRPPGRFSLRQAD
jgi:hypothetical protein